VRVGGKIRRHGGRGDRRRGLGGGRWGSASR
jgi:hypothetical protein